MNTTHLVDHHSNIVSFPLQGFKMGKFPYIHYNTKWNTIPTTPFHHQTNPPTHHHHSTISNQYPPHQTNILPTTQPNPTQVNHLHTSSPSSINPTSTPHHKKTLTTLPRINLKPSPPHPPRSKISRVEIRMRTYITERIIDSISSWYQVCFRIYNFYSTESSETGCE